MSNVLLVTYLFPPSGGVGVPRAIAYARYLPENGCKVVVLAPARPSTAYHDPELEALVPAETTVYRAFNPELPYALKNTIWRKLAARGIKRDLKFSDRGKPSPSRLIRRAAQKVFFPDVQATWRPFAVRAARRIIRQHSIDTVILNAPPYSLLQIGLQLKDEFPHLRLITDLRDDWLGYYAIKSKGPSDYDSGWSESEWQRARQIENAAFERSSYVSIATPAWVADLRARYPSLSPEKFICTTNGYEPELFRDFHSRPHGTDKLIVTYFGTLNASRVYSPKTYLDALDSLPAEVQCGIETRFIGRVTADCAPLITGRDNVRVLGFQTKAKGFEFLEESDYLLLIATNPSSHAGKLFDYLATGKPIIALCPPDSEIAAILRETRTGMAIDPWDTQAVARVLEECYRTRRFGREQTLQPNWTAVLQYSWPAIVHGLAEKIGLVPSPTVAEL